MGVQGGAWRQAVPAAIVLSMVLALVAGAGGFGGVQVASAAPGLVQFPGTFEVEDYKAGGQGIGYSDTTPGNSGKAYRNDDVDLQSCTDPVSGEGCVNVAWIKPGEWLAYDIEVTAGGEFVLETRVATPHDGRRFSFTIDGTNVTGSIAVPNTGGHQNWTTVTSPAFTLAAGRYELRLVTEESSFNLNRVTARHLGGAQPVAQASPTYWVAPDGNDQASGTEHDPWRSIGASMKRLRAGDTLMVRGGTYYERVEVRGSAVPRGTPDARITVQAAPGEEPLVVGIFWVSNADYWTFDNIDVTWDRANRNTEETMVRLWGGTGWIWQNSVLSGARSYAGLAVSGDATDWVIRGNFIHDTLRANDLSQDHLIYISDASNGVIERNVLVNAPNGRGVKLGNPKPGQGKPAHVVVRYNTIVNTGAGNVSFSYDAHDNEVYRNVLVIATNGYHSVNDWYVTGANNVVRENVTFESRGVFRASSGVVDGGGNLAHVDPQLNHEYRPLNPALYDADGVLQYGHLAGTTLR